MDGFKQGGLVQDIIGSLILLDRFKVQAHPSWRYMKYHEEQLQEVNNSVTSVFGHVCCCGERTMPEP